MQNNYLTYYQLLGVEPNATTEQVLKAYRDKIKKYHPDLNNNSDPANDMSKYITEARDCLTDPAKRLQYDYLIGVKKKSAPKAKINTVFVPKNNTDDIIAAGLAAGFIGLLVGVALGGKGGK